MDLSRKPIAVLGAGAWGTALAILLASNGQAVRLWDYDVEHMTLMQSERVNKRTLPDVVFPDSLTITLGLADAVHHISDILLVVPSHAFSTVLMQLKAYVSQPRFVWGTKGLDPKTGGFLSDTVSAIFPKKTPVAILSGPSFAKEVAEGMPTVVSLASNNTCFSDELILRFQNKNFSVIATRDVIGVQLAGVFKNVTAIATGMLDGMGFGTNTRSALITCALSELDIFIQALGGGARDTTLSSAGVGDMILTCTDNQSRNRRFGLALGKGASAEAALKEIGQSVEGYYNAKQLTELAKKNNVKAPIIEQVYAILYEGRGAKTLLSVLSIHA